MRVVELNALIDDDRLFATAIGRGVVETRSRVKLVLAGSSRVVGMGRAKELHAGEGLIVAPLALLRAISGPCVVVEIDWAGGSASPGWTTFRLSDSLARAGLCVASALVASGSGEATLQFTEAAHDLVRILRADGIDVPFVPALAHDAGSQRIFDALDGALTRLDLHPQSVDLETQLGCSRWTLARRLHEVSTTYGVSGKGGATDWRSMRDHRRLLHARVLLTAADARVPAVARAVGYRSMEAMCHAFADAGLPSPAGLRRATLADL
jgi:AraC-like DNA-binding protein